MRAESLSLRVLETVDAIRERIIDLACRLVEIPSVSPDYPGGNREELLGGESRVNEHLAGLMAKAGAQNHWVERVEDRRNLVSIVKGSGGGRSLILNGHVDTVLPVQEDGWRSGSPWKSLVHDGQLYGLGSTDMKGPIAAQCGAALALVQAGIHLKGDLLLQWTCGEEMHQHELGLTACLEAGFTADAAIVSESSTVGGQLCVMPVSPGVLHARVMVPGKSAHCCARHEAIRPGGLGARLGVNAIEKAVFIIDQVKRLEDEWGISKRHALFKPGFFTLHPGFIRGGPGKTEAPYALADHCLVEYLITFSPSESCADVEREFEQYIGDVCRLDTWLKDNPPTITWVVEWEPFETDAQHPFVQSVQRAHDQVAKTAFPLAGFGAVCDATYYGEKGIPCVVFGPGSFDAAHSLDERIRVDELITAAKTIALAAVEWCGLEET